MNPIKEFVTKQSIKYGMRTASRVSDKNRMLNLWQPRNKEKN
jgi:hypothetical protein